MATTIITLSHYHYIALSLQGAYRLLGPFANCYMLPVTLLLPVPGSIFYSHLPDVVTNTIMSFIIAHDQPAQCLNIFGSGHTTIVFTVSVHFIGFLIFK